MKYYLVKEGEKLFVTDSPSYVNAIGYETKEITSDRASYYKRVISSYENTLALFIDDEDDYQSQIDEDDEDDCVLDEDIDYTEDEW